MQRLMTRSRRMSLKRCAHWTENWCTVVCLNVSPGTNIYVGKFGWFGE